MGQDPSDEKRQDPRTPIELRVEYKKLNSFFFDYTRNISRGGTFIKTSGPLPIGTLFLFKLFVPELTDPLTLVGQVKWIVSDQDVAGGPEAREPGMGIEFVYDTEEDRLRVEKAVEKLMVAQLGERAYAKLMGKA